MDEIVSVLRVKGPSQLYLASMMTGSADGIISGRCSSPKRFDGEGQLMLLILPAPGHCCMLPEQD